MVGDVLCDQEELQGTSLRRELPASKPSTSLRRGLPASKPSYFQIKVCLLQKDMNDSVKFLKWKQVMKSTQRPDVSSCTWKMESLVVHDDFDNHSHIYSQAFA